MTVAQLQELLSNFDPGSTVHFSYPDDSRDGLVYQVRTQAVVVGDHVDSKTGTVSPILFLEGTETVQD